MDASRGMRRLVAVADDLLVEVEAAERVKAAELQAVRAATPRHRTEVGAMLTKVAGLLRTDDGEVTYADLRAHVGGVR